MEPVAHAVGDEEEDGADEEEYQRSGGAEEEVAPVVRADVVRDQVDRGHYEHDPRQGGEEALLLLRVVEGLRQDVERALQAGRLLDEDFADAVDGDPRRDDRVRVLVLRAVTHEDGAVRPHLAEDEVQLLYERLVGAVPDLLVPADERHLARSRGLRGLQVAVDVHRRVEGVRVGVLGVGDPQRGGRGRAGVDADDGRGHAALGAEVVVPVYHEDQGLFHRP